MKKDTLWPLIILLMAALVLAIVNLLPLDREERTIIPVRHSPGAIVLQAGESIVQRLVLAPGTYSGVVLYSEADRLVGQPLVVVIRDRSGDELARGQYTRAAFAPADTNLLRLEIATGWWQLSEPDHVLVEVYLESGRLPLRVTSNPELYRFGELKVAGSEVPHDLALSLLSPARLAFGARQGVLAAVVVVLGLMVLQLLPRTGQRWWAAVVLVAVAAPLALAGYWFSVDKLGIADWDYYFSLHHWYRQSLLAGAFPFWNPYACGGTAGLADPEFPLFSLTFLLEFVFGIPIGARLAIYLSVMVGAWGMLALGKRLALSPQAAFLSALAVSFGTVNLLEVTEGHVNVFAAMWIPWIFWAWHHAYGRRNHRAQNTHTEQSTKHRAPQHKPVFGIWNVCFGSLRRWRHSNRTNNYWALLCGVFLALTFYQGGIYLLMYTGLAFLTLFWLVSRPREAVLVTVQAGLWALGLTAVKLVPVLLWLRQFPDEAYAGSAYTLPWLTDILFGRYVHGAYVITDQVSGWHEYGAYIGYVVFALALIGISQIRRSRVVRGLVIGAVLTVVLSALGPHLEPLFDQLWFFPRSNISRIILLSVMALALLAGFGLDHLKKRWKVNRWVIGLLVGAAAVEIFSLSYQLSEQAFVLPEVYPLIEQAPEPIAFTAQRFDLAGEGSRTTRSYSAARVGWGTQVYCSVLGPRPAVRTVHDEGGSVLIGAAQQGTDIELLEWSPNTVRALVTAPDTTELTLNTNYAQGWTVNGQPASEIAGLVGLNIGEGTHELTFRYRTPGFRLGLAVTLLTVALALWQVRKMRSRK